MRQLNLRDSVTFMLHGNKLHLLLNNHLSHWLVIVSEQALQNKNHGVDLSHFTTMKLTFNKTAGYVVFILGSCTLDDIEIAKCLRLLPLFSMGLDGLRNLINIGG